VTCGIECREKLCREGPPNHQMCNYCHRKPKRPSSNQCSGLCEENAKTACLLCKSQPKFRRTYLCGKPCQKIIARWSPYLILEAPRGHVTYNMVEQRFIENWKYSGTASRPPIRKIYKIIMAKAFFEQYQEYMKRVGNEQHAYHGTTKAPQCTLGTLQNAQLCSNNLCSLCSILRTSFKASYAKSYTAFGAGIYTSTASNKAYNYTESGRGAMIVSTVALGKVFNVSAFAEVKSCPVGFNSIVFDRGINGSLNETVVYDDDAIRPVYLIFF
ncbi:ADP-ribosylation, partial [Pholiota conissans]